jgi:hypothetical protein
LDRQFSEEEIQTANKHIKKCSTPLDIKETQIETILRFHLTLVTLAGKDAGKKKPSYSVAGSVN